MNQKIWVTTPALDDQGRPLTDRHGDPVAGERLDFPAGVQRKINVIRSPDGTLHETNVEIDAPFDAPIKGNMPIEYETIDGKLGSGTVIEVVEATNLSKTRILFKVLMVDGEG